jgi:simple sugar transport system ATP-binding protein
MAEVLRVENLAKRFGPVTALRDVNLHLERGEVLGLLGDNGAGKSTLVKILSGYHQPDEGTIYLDGEPVELHSVIQARSLGIDTVYQDLALVNELSVFHNVFLNRELMYPLPFRLLNNREMRRRAAEYIDDIGVDIPSASGRRSRSPARCTPTRRSCCSTSRWPRWGCARGRSSSTSSSACARPARSRSS